MLQQGRRVVWYRRTKLALTYRCNAACTHCTVKDTVEPSPPMALEELQEFALQGRLAGIRRVVLFGGEPTIRRDFMDIVKTMATYVPFVVVDTNALVIDDAFAERAAAAGLGRAQVSLHGPDRELNRMLFGADTFDRAVRGIRALRRHGIEVHFSTVPHVPLLEGDRIERLIALAHELDCQGIRFLFPSGPRVQNLSPAQKFLVRSHCDGEFTYIEGETNTDYSCGAVSRGFFYASPQGEIQPCPYLPLDVGRFREEPLVNAARRGTRDLPWLEPDEVSDCGIYRAAKNRGMRSFYQCEEGEEGATPLVVTRNDNYLDFSRPAEDADALLSELEQQVGKYSHVYFSGGAPSEHPAFGPALALVRGAERGVTLVQDPRLLGDSAWSRLEGTETMRVIVPVRLGSEPSGVAAPSLDEAYVDDVAASLGELRARQIPVEFLLLSVGPLAEEDHALIDLLADTFPEQITQVVVGAPGRGAGVGHVRGLLPALAGYDVSQPQLLLHRGRRPGVVRPVEMAQRGNGTVRERSADAFLRLERYLARPLAERWPPTRFELVTDLEGALVGMAALERVLPKLAAGGHRLTLKRVGADSWGQTEAEEYNELLLIGPGAWALRRFQELETVYGDAFEWRGFGPILFRPWSSPEHVHDAVKLVLGTRPLGHPKLRELLNEFQTVDGLTYAELDDVFRDYLLRAALLRDTSPPLLAGAGDRFGWSLRDGATASTYRVAVAAAAILEGRAPTQPGPEPEAIAAALARLPEEKQNLRYVVSRLADNHGTLSGASATESRLCAVLGAPAPAEKGLDDEQRQLLALGGALGELCARCVEFPSSPLFGWSVGPAVPSAFGEPFGLSCRVLAPGDGSVGTVLRISTGGERASGWASARVSVSHGAVDSSVGGAVEAFLPLMGPALETFLAKAGEVGGSVAEAHGAAVAVFQRVAASQARALSAGGRRLAGQAKLVRRVLSHLPYAPASPLPGWHLEGFEEHEADGGYGIQVALRRASERMELTLLPADVPLSAAANGVHVKLTYSPRHPPDAETRRRGLPRLCRVLDHYLERHG